MDRIAVKRGGASVAAMGARELNRVREIALALQDVNRVPWLADGTFKGLARMATDPVCGMAVAQQDGPHFQFDGTTWWFCAPTSRDEFAGDPHNASLSKLGPTLRESMNH